MLLYRILRFLTFPIFWIVYKFKFKEMPSNFYEKMGRPTRDRPNGEIIWVHSNKSSEAEEIIRVILSEIPRARILQTYNVLDYGPSHTQSVIGQTAPLDSPLIIKNFLRFWEPSMAIRLGSEIRPVQLYMLKRYGFPSFLVNAHMSKKSYRRWKLIKRLARKTIEKLTFIWTTNNEQVLRFANLGATNIESEALMPRWSYLSEIIQKIEVMRYNSYN